ncbi:MAG: hypothetical protein EP329_18720 [Deltaproteobacteria bacterium]|nr:MAG: hypothetical protein EP329_18720 [Deltaproteobacteria bacterium]
MADFGPIPRDVFSDVRLRRVPPEAFSLFIVILAQVDPHGLFEADPVEFATTIRRVQDVEYIANHLDALRAAGLIRVYFGRTEHDQTILVGEVVGYKDYSGLPDNARFPSKRPKRSLPEEASDLDSPAQLTSMIGAGAAALRPTAQILNPERRAKDVGSPSEVSPRSTERASGAGRVDDEGPPTKANGSPAEGSANSVRRQDIDREREEERNRDGGAHACARETEAAPAPPLPVKKTDWRPYGDLQAAAEPVAGWRQDHRYSADRWLQVQLERAPTAMVTANDLLRLAEEYPSEFVHACQRHVQDVRQKAWKRPLSWLANECKFVREDTEDRHGPNVQPRAKPTGGMMVPIGPPIILNDPMLDELDEVGR